MKPSQLRVLFLLALGSDLAACACEPPEHEWYLDEDGCAVGNVFVVDESSFAEIAQIDCFRNILSISKVNALALERPFFKNLRSVGTLAVGDLLWRGDEKEDGSGVVLSLDNLTNIAGLATGHSYGLVRLEVPSAVDIDALTLENEPNLLEARFDSLERVNTWLAVRHCSDLEVLYMPKLKSVGPNQHQFSFHIEVAAIRELSFPELEVVEDAMVIDGVGCEPCFGGSTYSFPKLASVHGFLRIADSAINAIHMPMLTEIGSLQLWGVFNVGDISNFAVKKVGSLSLSSWVNSQYQMTLPQVTEVGSMTVKMGYNAHTVYMPVLETLGSLYIEESWGLREVDFPSITCLGLVTTGVCQFSNHPYCLLPEELDDEVERSRAGGCEPTIDICDPRDNVYFPYNEQWCVDNVP
jgi:hypothetical protein